MAKCLSKPQVYKSDIALSCDRKPVNADYKKTMLTFSIMRTNWEIY